MNDTHNTERIQHDATPMATLQGDDRANPDETYIEAILATNDRFLRTTETDQEES
ncbi:MAG: hypothetical protein AAFN27_14960 [Pseudomonadota bacterium]